MDITNNRTIIVIGEVLVDIFADYQRMGGAPFNFAFHLNAFNYYVDFISKIGKDSIGANILNFMDKHKISYSNIQTDEIHPTGRVMVTVNDKGVPNYNIVENSAYDFIEYTDKIEKALKYARMIYIGTLAQRNQGSFNTIRKILTKKEYNTQIFYDINLRQNYFNKCTIDNSLKYADIVKLNEEELRIIKGLYKETCSNNHFIKTLIERYNIRWLSLTKGEKGSMLFYKDKTLQISPKITSLDIIDTVGAGDAYSAILAIGILNNWSMEKILERATEFSAAICGTHGAVPEDSKFYERFKIWQ